MRRTPLALAPAVAAGLLLAPALPAEAAPPVKIYLTHFDSYGSKKDDYTNASLNDEYVVLRNTTSTARSLTGWTVRDRTGFTYKFPAFTLRAGATVTIRTGKGTASTTNRYYNRTSYVWNNTGDTAYLRNASGTLQHSCAAGGATKYC